jgi:hypothetical protein
MHIICEGNFTAFILSGMIGLSSTTTKDAALYGDLSSDRVIGYEVCDIVEALFSPLGKTHGPIYRTKMVGGEDIRCGVAVLLPPQLHHKEKSSEFAQSPLVHICCEVTLVLGSLIYIPVLRTQ